MAGSPFPDKLRLSRRVLGDHRRHHGRLALPREITVAIMTGYPLLASRSLSGGSPSPSWPVSLSQGDHRRHHGRLPFARKTRRHRGITVAIMAGYPFQEDCS